MRPMAANDTRGPRGRPPQRAAAPTKGPASPGKTARKVPSALQPAAPRPAPVTKPKRPARPSVRDLVEAAARRPTAKPAGAARPRPEALPGPRSEPRPEPAPTPAESVVSSGVRAVTVAEDRDGQRLDNFLLGQLKGAPRSLVYKLVRSGQVRINGKRAKADSRVSGGDEVRIPPVRLETPGEVRPPPKGMLDRLAASIVFEDARILAVNKPSGIATHGGSGVSHGLIESMRALRPGEPLELVHRLDRDTSGVLILAKKRSALLELQALMRGGEDDEGPGKQYLTLLVGRLPNGTMTVDAPLQKSVLQGGERSVRVDPSGKPSVSHFKVLERRR